MYTKFLSPDSTQGLNTNQNQIKTLKILKALDQELGLPTLLTCVSHFQKQKERMDLFMLTFRLSIDE